MLQRHNFVKYCKKVKCDDFITLLYESARWHFTVVKWYSGKVVKWWHFTVVKWWRDNTVVREHFTVIKWYSGNVIKQREARARCAAERHISPGPLRGRMGAGSWSWELCPKPKALLSFC